MIHTLELLYILNRRAATYCSYRLNRHVNAAERYDGTDIRTFLQEVHIRRNSAGLHFKGLRIPGIHQIDLVKYKDAPGSFFLYITIEPQVLLTGENSNSVFFCSPDTTVQLQHCYARGIYELFPKSFEGRPPISQARYHDQQHVQPVEWSFGMLFAIPYLGLSLLSRIDFCVNYRLPNSALYVEMIQKSYYSSRKKKIRFHNLNPFSEDRSHDALFYDKTSGFCIYDKYSKMMDQAKDNMHNISHIRKDAKDVIRIERPFYKITKQKLFRLSGLALPKAEEGRDAPLKLGPIPFLWDERVGLEAIILEYRQCVLGLKRGQKYDPDQQELKWVSLKRFVREMDRLYDSGRITKQRHDTVLKMAYATSEARSVKNAVHNCDAGTHIWWGHDEEDNKIRIEFQRSKHLFIDTWHDMHELGMMLMRIPANRHVAGTEDNDWEAKELDANFIFKPDLYMTGIEDSSKEPNFTHYDFLPYKVIRGYDTPDPLEMQYNYEEITRILYQWFDKYIYDSQKAYEERRRRRNCNKKSSSRD